MTTPHDTHTLREGLIEEYADALFCMDSYCDKNGTTVTVGLDGNPEQAQCEYCYRERFPRIEQFRTALTTYGAKEREATALSVERQLAPWLRHDGNCALEFDAGDCDCGLWEARRQLDPQKDVTKN